MNNKNRKRTWNIIIAVTAFIWMGLAGSAFAQINVINPTSSTVVKDNEDLEINWYYSGDEVDIMLWKTNSPAFYLAKNVSSSYYGTYYWTVPDHFPEGDDYFIRVLEAGVYPISPPAGTYGDSSTFTIEW